MGLFGFGGPKKSEAQKAYEAVYSKFPSKKAGVEDLKAALQAWEAADGPQTEAWKAYFKMALAWDCGQNMELDEAAAKPYHDKVWEILNQHGTEQEKDWVNTFYYWYNQGAVNCYRKLDQQTLNIRRLGNAEMHVLSLMLSGRMLDEIKKVMNDVWFGSQGEASKTASIYYGYLNAWHLHKGEPVDYNEPEYAEKTLPDVKDFEKKAVKESKAMEKVRKASEKERKKGLEKKASYADVETDLYLYMYGYQFFNPAPAAFGFAFNNINNPIIYGLKQIFEAAYLGNSMAVHYLVYLAKEDPENHVYVEQAFSSPYRTLDAFLHNALLECERNGDPSARKLLERHFTRYVDADEEEGEE